MRWPPKVTTMWPTKIENRHFPRKLRVQSQIWVHITFFNFFFRIFWAGFQRHTLMYMFRRILFSFFWKKISSTIKLLQMWTKKSNPQNFIKHSCPKVASDLVCFWKFQKKIFLHLVEIFFEFLNLQKFKISTLENKFWFMTIQWRVVLDFLFDEKAPKIAIEKLHFKWGYWGFAKKWIQVH